MIYSAMLCDPLFMLLDTPGSRLKWARQQAGFPDAATFAKAAGVNPTTYRAYENDQNAFAHRAPEFGRRLGVTSDWLIAGGPLPDVVEPGTFDDFSSRIPGEAQLADLLQHLLQRGGGPEDAGWPRFAAAILHDILEDFAADPSEYAEAGRAGFAARTLAGKSERRRA